MQAGYLEEGSFYYQNGNYEKAEQLYLKAIQNENIFAFYYLGNLYNEQKKYDKAKNLFLIAINYKSIKETAVQNLFKLSLHYFATEDLKNGLELMTIAAENGNLNAIQLLAKMHYEMGEFTRAKKYFKMASNLGDKEAKENYIKLTKAGY